MGRIGFFGGSFDPVHLGHLLVAQAAREELQLDRIYFIPANESPFKPDRRLAASASRVALLRLALCGNAYCEIDCQELERGGVSYTIDTVQSYAARFPGVELYYLIGADHVEQLGKWRKAQELAGMIEFVVIPRPGELAPAAPAGFRTRNLTGFPLGVSSSQIRARVKGGRPIDFLTGSAVAESIRNNGLYL